MAIRVDHGVGPVVPAAAYGSGMMRGQRRYGQQAAQFAESMLGRRRRREEADRQFALAEYDRMRQQQRDAFSDAMSLDERNYQRQQDAIQNDLRSSQVDRNYELDLANLNQRRLENTPGVLGLSEEEVTGRPIGELNDYNQQMWNVDSARVVDRQASDVQAQYRNESFTPEGQRVWNQLQGDLRAIQGSRGTLRPNAYSEAMQQWFDRVDSAGLQNYRQKPPTVESELSSRMMRLPDGRTAILQPDGKLQFESPESRGEELDYGSLIDEAEKSLFNRNKQLENPRDMVANPPTEKEITDEVNLLIERKRMKDRIRQQFRGTDMTSVPNQNPQSGSLRQQIRQGLRDSGGMYRDETGRIRGATEDDLRNALSNAGEQISEEDIQKMLGQESLAQFKAMGSQNPRQDMLDYWMNTFTPAPGPGPATGVLANDVTDVRTRSQLATKPRPKSQKEYDELPSGTLYIAPNGETRRKQ